MAGDQAWNWNSRVMSAMSTAGSLSPEGRRALAAFLAGRLPAGQLHAELLRTEGHAPAAPPPLPADTATLPVPRALQVA
ncbi:MAG: hypothetical protein ABW228_07245 [Thermoleophilaceae bacterium]